MQVYVLKCRAKKSPEIKMVEFVPDKNDDVKVFTKSNSGLNTMGLKHF